jgi:hypothetical protein
VATTASSAAAQRDVLIAFFSAFSGFTAFGAVIATFLASSDALSWLGAFWGWHGLNEVHEGGKPGFVVRNRRGILLWAVGGGIGLAALVSCAGLVISFFWLDASTAPDAVGGGWAYRWAGVLLLIEVGLITAITLLIAVSSAFYAVNESKYSARDFVGGMRRRRWQSLPPDPAGEPGSSGLGSGGTTASPAG